MHPATKQCEFLSNGATQHVFKTHDDREQHSTEQLRTNPLKVPVPNALNAALAVIVCPAAISELLTPLISANTVGLGSLAWNDTAALPESLTTSVEVGTPTSLAISRNSDQHGHSRKIVHQFAAVDQKYGPAVPDCVQVTTRRGITAFEFTVVDVVMLAVAVQPKVICKCLL